MRARARARACVRGCVRAPAILRLLFHSCFRFFLTFCYRCILRGTDEDQRGLKSYRACQRNIVLTTDLRCGSERAREDEGGGRREGKRESVERESM